MTHDDGWKEADAEPMVKPDGDPRSFHEMKISDGVPIYLRSIEQRKAEGQTYAAALITGHFLSLVENADLGTASTVDAVAAGKYIAQQRHELDLLKEEIAKRDDGEDLLKSYDTNLRFLQVCDYLSLLLCTNFNDEDTIENVPYLANGDKLRVVRSGNLLALSIDPLPFKKNLRDHLTSFIIPYMPYDSTEELQMAMEEVKTVKNEVHIGKISK